jgi:hypothetical protein
MYCRYCRKLWKSCGILSVNILCTIRCVNAAVGQRLGCVTDSMEQSASGVGNQFAAGLEISGIFFMEPEGSLPHSQVPAKCPYPKPTLSSPHKPVLLPEGPS